MLATRDGFIARDEPLERARVRSTSDIAVSTPEPTASTTGVRVANGMHCPLECDGASTPRAVCATRIDPTEVTP